MSFPKDEEKKKNVCEGGSPPSSKNLKAVNCHPHVMMGLAPSQSANSPGLESRIPTASSSEDC